MFNESHIPDLIKIVHETLMSTPNLKFGVILWCVSEIAELLCSANWIFDTLSVRFSVLLTLENMILRLNLCVYIYNVTLVMCAILTESILYFYMSVCVCLG